MPARPAPKLDEIAKAFSALAHEARRHIVLLLGHSGGELPSGYLAKRFHHSWPTTTRHLAVLEQAGLVTVRREGRSSHYRLEREHLQRVLGGWLGLLEAPTPTTTWAATGPRTTAELAARVRTISRRPDRKKGRRR
ncbi:MAG TPA: metalloregulator ArsR/SmtB family transcription factor [Polyangiaceae bacterium]|nr:metalloregulator ArsR/SmtB family transcription factor [Polyangiaceae bacterium]